MSKSADTKAGEEAAKKKISDEDVFKADVEAAKKHNEEVAKEQAKGEH